MRNECQIVRDLMPLCIDHAASQDSQELVDEHISTCETCAEIYGEMTRALPKLQSVRDSHELARTVRQMQRRKALRAVLLVAAAFLVGMLVMLLVNGIPKSGGPATYPLATDGDVVRVETDAPVIYDEPAITNTLTDAFSTQGPNATLSPFDFAMPTPIPWHGAE